ncbi:MAG: hypothetical protein APF84_13645 [Gracilibacter sp. BRH_c7a]|nr:MAG: hypothetical protein APF84_13645 [Gracilibacter sp. BRH_c7a]
MAEFKGATFLTLTEIRDALKSKLLQEFPEASKAKIAAAVDKAMALTGAMSKPLNYMEFYYSLAKNIFEKDF